MNISKQKFDRLSTKDNDCSPEELHTLGQCYVGQCTVDSKPIDFDKAKAEASYKKAYDKGYTLAALELGLLYERERKIEGEGKADSAIRWITKAAKKGDSLSCYHLGRLYEVYKKDFKTAITHYQRAITGKIVDPNAAKRMRDYYIQGADIQRALDLYTSLVDKGASYAQYELGKVYELKGDKQKAFDWCKKAANQSPPYLEAVCWLGKYYHRQGRNYPGAPDGREDFDTAEKYYQIAAEGGLPEAQYAYGKFLCEKYNLIQEYLKPCGLRDSISHLQNWGLTVNDFKAFLTTADTYFQKAALNNDPDALNIIAGYYEFGSNGFEINPRKVFQYSKQSSDQGNLEGKHNLAYCYEYGIGVDQDEDMAYDLYAELARSNYTPAFNSLGRCHEFGIGCDRDLKIAFSWYEKAAKLDDGTGLKNIGRCCHDYQVQIPPSLSKKTINVREHIIPDTDLPKKPTLEQLRTFEKETKKNLHDYKRLSYLGIIYSNISSEKKAYVCQDEGVVDAKKSDIFLIKATKLNSSMFAKFAGVSTDEKQKLDYYNQGITYNETSSEGFKASLGTLQKFAEKGNIKAINYLGDYYQSRQPEEAFAYYTIAANKADSYAQDKLGYLYAHGIGTPKDAKKSNKYYKLAAENGSRDAECKLASMLEDKTETFKVYQQLSEQKHPDNTYYLACCYEKGQGVDKDIAKAKELYKLAAEQGSFLAVGHIDDKALARKLTKTYVEKGDRDAQYHLGYEYLLNNNSYQAVRYFKRAAIQNDQNAQMALGDWALSGEHGMPKNTKIAFEYYQKAYKNNPENPDIRRRMADCYLRGLGTTCELKKALEMYEKLAKENDMQSLYILGNLYLRGEYGVKKDLNLAAGYAEKAANITQSEPVAINSGIEELFENTLPGEVLCNLATLYLLGKEKGFEKNEKKAFEIYTKAAAYAPNNPAVQYYLGLCHEKGFGTAIDLIQAKKYYTLSANQDFDLAKQALGQYSMGQKLDVGGFWTRAPMPTVIDLESGKEKKEKEAQKTQQSKEPEEPPGKSPEQRF